ncbi:MAG TPA: group II intron reverse transcriptase/maturase [Flavobacteriales bacterium]|nr:group II intron reverse transcriptase/maturase [Flavobacteriales bacterium]
MIEQVLSNRNIREACAHVVSNKGSAGVDGMTTDRLDQHLRERGKQLVASVRDGNYHRKAILGVAIPKSNGKIRLLGIPTVEDRMLHQAVHQAMMPLFEVEFKAHSYGFRPKRNAQQAVLRAQQYINEGYQHIVDIDLQSFFDEVEHCKLLQLVYRKVKCATTLSLIRQWLRAPILVKGKLVKRRKGVPQGSPLSPLLSNIMLHELDRLLERQGLPYVRYADDFSIYLKSKSKAKKVGNKVYLFLKNRLKLPINRAKSGIRRPVQFTLLGYGFVPTYVKGERGKYQLVVQEGSWQSLKQRLKAITRKTRPTTLSERISQLKEVQRGWLHYFRLASMTGKLRDIDGWVRNRLRYCIWKHWKKPERRRKNLIRLGVDYDHAYAWSRTRKGGWAIAQSPILITTITLKRFAARGYESMLDHYNRIAPHLNEPLYTRTVRTVV